MSLSIPFPFCGWLLNKKAARVEVNISLAFLHWVRITFHPWPFFSDIAIFVLKRDVKLQLTNSFALQWAIGDMRTLPLSPLKGGSQSQFLYFLNIITRLGDVSTAFTLERDLRVFTLFGYNSADIEGISVKSGILWLYCRGTMLRIWVRQHMHPPSTHFSMLSIYGFISYTMLESTRVAIYCSSVGESKCCLRNTMS